MTNASSTMRNSTRNSHGGRHNDFGSKIAELRTLLADLASSAPSAASDTFDELKSKAVELRDTCQEKVSDATHAVVKTVKEHPAQVALAAVGVGLLAWWLMTRNSSKAEYLDD